MPSSGPISTQEAFLTSIRTDRRSPASPAFAAVLLPAVVDRITAAKQAARRGKKWP
jgi:hypothetical protein